MKECIIVLLLVGLLSTYQGKSQGCVAVRSNGTCGGMNGNGFNLLQGETQVFTAFRHFRSFRHFRGDHEESERVANGTEVVNLSNFLDIGASYGLTDRWFVTAVIPFVFHDRSSMYEHGGNPPNGLGQRHHTQSSGIGDIRLNMAYWLFAPGIHSFNYSVGVGVKLPTGNYHYTDLFYNQGSSRNENTEQVVDQAIQPGDGGTGWTLELQGFHQLSQRWNLSSNFFYMVNPKETNGILTRNGRSEFSCPDQYGARLGTAFIAGRGFSAYLGGRWEGVPAEDLIGGSAGFRRPGYAISAEPGIGYNSGPWSLFASAPLAVYRNRTQSYEDKQRTLTTGTYSHGDAAFADYLLSINVSYRFGMHAMPSHEVPSIQEAAGIHR